QVRRDLRRVDRAGTASRVRAEPSAADLQRLAARLGGERPLEVSEEPRRPDLGRLREERLREDAEQVEVSAGRLEESCGPGVRGKQAAAFRPVWPASGLDLDAARERPE